MPIIDSQVHAYEANTPRRPWHSVPKALMDVLAPSAPVMGYRLGYREMAIGQHRPFSDLNNLEAPT
jgi:hypothetical protein